MLFPLPWTTGGGMEHSTAKPFQGNKIPEQSFTAQVASGFVKDSDKSDDWDKLYITRTRNGNFSWRKYCIWSYDLPTDQILNCPPLSRITWPNAIYCHFSSTGGTRRHHFLQESHLCPLLLLTYEYRFKGKLPPTAHFSSLFILFLEGAGHVWALCDHTALGPL